LFSLATAQVFIINIWENSIGLYHAANLNLLKTVFEVNLSLFQKRGSPKTLLLFVIRDYVGTTPKANLVSTIVDDMNSLWKSLTKNAICENTLFSDFFDVDFVTLPHKILQPEKFNKELDSLSQR
jgi:protein SEY1